MSDDDRARLAVLGVMIFSFLEAMDIGTVKKVNALLVWQRDNWPATTDSVYNKCVEAEFERFIVATDAVIR